MITQLDIFMINTRPGLAGYPNAPGYKVPGPSKEAATAVAPSDHQGRAMCLEQIKKRPMASDEVADALGLSVLYVRPRVSQLHTKGKIRDSGKRYTNRSGKPATVWEAV